MVKVIVPNVEEYECKCNYNQLTELDLIYNQYFF